MRLVIGQLLVLVNRYPTLVDGAFVIIAWVGVKLILEYLHAAGYVHFEVPRALSLGLIVVIFVIAFVWARIEGPVEADPLAEKAEEILGAESEAIAETDGDVRKG
jgi:predicted tellurium resistance membrane protein TerC